MKRMLTSNIVISRRRKLRVKTGVPDGDRMDEHHGQNKERPSP
jgi:hypothetical protein